jgi:hypothetical protein
VVGGLTLRMAEHFVEDGRIVKLMDMVCAPVQRIKVPIQELGITASKSLESTRGQGKNETLLVSNLCGSDDINYRKFYCK